MSGWTTQSYHFFTIRLHDCRRIRRVTEPQWEALDFEEGLVGDRYADEPVEKGLRLVLRPQLRVYFLQDRWRPSE